MKILLIADVPNWAFDRDAHAIKKFVPEFEFTIKYLSDVGSIDFSLYDHVHHMNWFNGIDNPQKFTAGVSSYNFKLIHPNESSSYFSKFKALVAVNSGIYESIKNKNKNVFCFPGGVHHELFKYSPLPDNDKFIVGYVSQKTSGKIDIKGYEKILKPLVKKLKEKRDDIEFKMLLNNYTNSLPYKKMPDFYKGTHCVLCTSLREGAPNSLVEGASCGRAIVSLRVGVAPEIVNHNYNGFISEAYDLNSSPQVIERTINALASYIETLADNRLLCKKMGKRSREIIESNWSWEIRAREYFNFFNIFKK